MGSINEITRLLKRLWENLVWFHVTETSHGIISSNQCCHEGEVVNIKHELKYSTFFHLNFTFPPQSFFRQMIQQFSFFFSKASSLHFYTYCARDWWSQKNEQYSLSPKGWKNWKCEEKNIVNYEEKMKNHKKSIKKDVLSSPYS